MGTYMHKEAKESLAEIHNIGDNITIELISNLIRILVDNLRMDNDYATTEEVIKNQGGIKELQRLNKLLTGKE